jgi:hypothetical protein
VFEAAAGPMWCGASPPAIGETADPGQRPACVGRDRPSEDGQ